MNFSHDPNIVKYFTEPNKFRGITSREMSVELKTDL